jgi:hypothetical protein
MVAQGIVRARARPTKEIDVTSIFAKRRIFATVAVAGWRARESGRTPALVASLRIVGQQ